MRISNLLLTSAIAMVLAGQASAQDSAAENLSEANKEGRIWTSFALNPHLTPFEFTIDVEDDTAIIGGKVDDGIDRELAETLALQVSGVNQVVNRIEVVEDAGSTPPQLSERSLAQLNQDATITASVKSKLLWNVETEGLAIDVDTNQNKVTLTGSVDDERSRVIAANIASGTLGVVSVDNRLRVDSGFKRAVSDNPVADAWIDTRVKSSLLYSRHVDGLDIQVDTTDGIVRLTGSVDSPEEKSLAIELTESVRGVKRVEASGLVVSA